MKNLLLLLALTITLVSCGGSNSKKAAQMAGQIAEWTGESVVVLKADTEMGGGWSVFDIDGFTFAVDLSLYEGDATQAIVEEYIFGTCSGCAAGTTKYWVHIGSTDGELYYGSTFGIPGGDASAYIFEEGNEATKDLEKMAASIQAQGRRNLAYMLEMDYGLSADRAIDAARLVDGYRKLSSKRSLTARELDLFSNELVGVDYSVALNATLTGDTTDLLETAARVNGTSPEAMGAILENLLQ